MDPLLKRQNVACGIPALAVPRNIMKQTTDLESPYNFLYTDRGLNRNKRIYGGEQATAGTIPWIVTFVFGDPSDSLARCGGSIIGPNFVVTAAHCAYGQTPSSVIFRPRIRRIFRKRSSSVARGEARSASSFPKDAGEFGARKSHKYVVFSAVTLSKES